MRVPALLGTVLALHVTASAWPRPAHSQWLVEVELASDRFWGGSVETTPEHRSFRPYHPATFGTGLERRWSSLGIGLRLRYADASLALEGADAVTAVKGVFTVSSASPDVSYRVASVGSANELRVRAGPLFEVWSMVDEKSRTRIGIQGAASLGIPLGSRFAGVLSAGVALIPSPFEDGELLPGYDLRALWRRRFAVGLQYRL
jgi:hypothetical protein